MSENTVEVPKQHSQIVQQVATQFFKHKSIQIPGEPDDPVKLEIDSTRTRFLFQNPTDSTAIIYLGGPSVIATFGQEERGFELLKGQSYFIDLMAMGEVYAICKNTETTWGTILEAR